MNTLKKLILLSLSVTILTLLSSFFLVLAIWPCSPCFSYFLFSDYYEGELKIRDTALEIDNVSVSASPDISPYVSIDKTSAKPGEVLTITGIDTTGNIEVNLSFRRVDTGIFYTDMAIINQSRKISILDLSCVNLIITTTIKNEGTENIELSWMGFFVNNFSELNPNCDKTVLGPSETTICNKIETGVNSNGVNELLIVGPSNKVKGSVFCDNIKTCTDSDGGKNYYVKGNVTVCTYTGQSGGCGQAVDQCGSDKRTITEGYCEGTEGRSVRYKCPRTCSDGRCVGGGGGRINVMMLDVTNTTIIVIVIVVVVLAILFVTFRFFAKKK